jgi:citrate synthase
VDRLVANDFIASYKGLKERAMGESKPLVNTGLRGIVIADTRICDVDGANGRLIYRGYLVQDLARDASFEEVVYLLLYEILPEKAALADFNGRLRAERALPEAVIAALKTRPRDALPMDILQSVVPMLAQHDPDVRDPSKEACLRMAVRLIAKFPTIVAAWDRIRNGKEPIQPSAELNQAGNFLYMLNGRMPDERSYPFF